MWRPLKRRMHSVSFAAPGSRLSHRCCSVASAAELLTSNAEESLASNATHTTKAPRVNWRDPKEQREYFERIAPRLGIKSLPDWYGISREQVEKLGGKRLFKQYRSLRQALKAVYPQFPWQSSGFVRTGQRERHRDKFDQIGDRLGIKEFSDWYTVRPEQIKQTGGEQVLRQYSSLRDAVQSIYSMYPWDPEKFIKTESELLPRRRKGSDRRQYILDALDKAERVLAISKPEDWYSVTLTDLWEIGFPRKINKLQLAEYLAEKYPSYPWEKVYLLKGRYAQQKRLEKAVASLFPGKEILINARKEADLVNPITGDFLELDIYVPELRLGFEYQERHHYFGTEHGAIDKIKQRDSIKQEAAAQKGITLITIPFWWDAKLESLVATIRKLRPKLVEGVEWQGEAIPDEMPMGFRNEGIPQVEDIGEPITAGFLTQSVNDPTNWWLFEKYDGVRGFWNPLKKAFYSRKGNKFTFPQEIIDAMPKDIFLDGELWFGRDNFQESIKISSRMYQAEVDWTKFKFMVFDVPTERGTYDERFGILERYFANNDNNVCKYVEMAPRLICEGSEHLEKFFQSVMDEGGEGIILRDPKAPYTPGRSSGYLKHKKFRDAEARIVEQVGPLQWECELPNGVRFTAVPGTTEFAKRWNPQKGDIVSFKHRGFLLATKKPKFATLHRLRPDLKWTDVIDNWTETKSRPLGLPMKRPKKRTNRKGHWQDVSNWRQLFISYANGMGFDPLRAENWTNVTKSQIRTKKGGEFLKLKGSLKDQLAKSFPELSFDFNEERQPVGYWANGDNCKMFFLAFAAEKGFDPLNRDNWKDVTKAQIRAGKGGGLLSRYKGSLKAALEASFPSVEWNFTARQPNGYWETAENRRKFFVSFAEEMGFDPLQPKNWDKITTTQILEKKGSALLAKHNYSLRQALAQTFPEMRL